MNAFGYLIKAMPLYLNIGNDDTIDSLTERTREQVEFARAHSNYPYITSITELDKVVRFIYQKNIIGLSKLETLVEEDIDLELAIASGLVKMQLLNIRKSKHLTQKQVSDICGLSEGCISTIESDNGNVSPTLRSVLKYANALGASLYIKLNE